MENQDQIMIKPNNYLALAIFTTICCCLPLGIVAIIKANSVDQLFFAKQYDAALYASKEAKKWCLIGMGISAFIVIAYLFIFGASSVASLGIFEYLMNSGY